MTNIDKHTHTNSCRNISIIMYNHIKNISNNTILIYIPFNFRLRNIFIEIIYIHISSIIRLFVLPI